MVTFGSRGKGPIGHIHDHLVRHLTQAEAVSRPSLLRVIARRRPRLRVEGGVLPRICPTYPADRHLIPKSDENELESAPGEFDATSRGQVERLVDEALELIGAAPPSVIDKD